MKLFGKFFGIAGMAMLLGTADLVAASAPKAGEIINNAFRYVGTLDKFAFDAIVVSDEAENGKIIKQYRQRVSVKVDRPDKFRIDTKGDLKNRTSYLDKGVFTMVDHGFDYYGQIRTGKDIDGTLDYLFERYGIKAPLAQLLYSNMHKRIHMGKSKYFGKVKLGNTECDYVAFSDRAKVVHVWIASGDRPLIKRFIVIDKLTAGHPRSIATIRWNLNADISDSDFVFKVPANASKVEVESTK